MIQRVMNSSMNFRSNARACFVAVATTLLFSFGTSILCPRACPPLQAQPGNRIKAPDFAGGKEWLGIDAPLTLKDLHGKYVLVDFWTLCCINCMQTHPEIAKLEKKFAKQLVVVGVHSPKFESEKSTKSVHQAMLRYEIDHPVINDADHNLWRSWSIEGWPTLILIDPEGYILVKLELERPNNMAVLENSINSTIRGYRANKLLNEELLPFQKKREEAKSGSLYFPGRVLADEQGKRLFISDSTHHRIVVTDLTGKHIATIGTGVAGKMDGAYGKAQFNDPQGLSLSGQTLYVADRKNHEVRAVDLKDQKVRTVAGTGRQGLDHAIGGSPLSTGLNSPWDVLAFKNEIFIANAGSCQLWMLDNVNARLRPFAGNGNEGISDGVRLGGMLAQPSGLATDNETLYWVDSESSSIRSMPINGRGSMRTIVGKGLFDYGDVDGDAQTTRLQHPLDLAVVGRRLFVADTYNSKIKEIELDTRLCWTLDLQPADPNEKGPLFDEPGGISHAGGKLYVADTNSHRVRVIDLDSKKVSTLALTGVDASAK